jgi:DNA polymerase-3 subunit beta
MKFACIREQLLEACQKVRPAVAPRTTKPVLSNVKAVAKDNTLTLTAYDMEVGIEYTISDLNVSRPGVGIMPIAELVKIASSAAENEWITVEVQEETILVRTTSGRFELPKMDADEFPDLPLFSNGVYHEVSSDSLTKAIRRTAFAADKKDTTAKFSLTGVMMKPTGKSQLRLVATDTKRLAVYTCDVTSHGADESKGKTVPLKAISLLSAVADGQVVKVSLRDNDAMFSTDGLVIYTALVNGKFPPYRDIMHKCRKNEPVKMSLPLSLFASSVRQAAIMVDDESMRVDFTFESGKLTMRARGAKTGASEVTMPLADYAGEKIDAAFDPKYITEFLRALDDDVEVVNFEIVDGNKPAIFSDGENSEYLVMPLT